MSDPYQILGLTRDASEKDIRTAYRKLAKQHHPDLNPGNAKAEERFKQISVANELLSDPEKRGKYDRGEIDESGHEQAPRSSYRSYADGTEGRRYNGGEDSSGGWNPEDLEEMFGSMFGAGRRGGGAKARDEHYRFNAGFLDAVNGATSRMTLPDGRVLDVRIPAGTKDGDVLRLRGQGGGKGDPAGDALITISVAPHEFFQRDGQDIRLVLPITLSEAVLGGSVDVPTPGGLVRMRLPPHSESGTELRLRGRGVPAAGKLAAGDLYANLRVMIGKPNAALENFLRSWTAEPGSPRQAMEEKDGLDR